ncbi:MAG: hypothetical protein UX87_C0016G0026 [Candidatus Amesbacteria bacterium GW2011_GWA1_47_16]|uniref:Uncharacterized protein n=1 Tax=Candidatus Amesbacteria bacterium GW2011_GWA1_47_16 TaxID=1618353 RepID=A0A0G1V1L2_9BACT|nr:MAG: hypothetical protein UX87_C0016G0026 [Candidatus Amesbacteria bacterium GW2011_GWA1_47_16]
MEEGGYDREGRPVRIVRIKGNQGNLRDLKVGEIWGDASTKKVLKKVDQKRTLEALSNYEGRLPHDEKFKMMVQNATSRVNEIRATLGMPPIKMMEVELLPDDVMQRAAGTPIGDCNYGFVKMFRGKIFTSEMKNLPDFFKEGVLIHEGVHEYVQTSPTVVGEGTFIKDVAIVNPELNFWARDSGGKRQRSSDRSITVELPAYFFEGEYHRKFNENKLSAFNIRVEGGGEWRVIINSGNGVLSDYLSSGESLTSADIMVQLAYEMQKAVPKIGGEDFITALLRCGFDPKWQKQVSKAVNNVFGHGFYGRLKSTPINESYKLLAEVQGRIYGHN